MTTSLFLPVVGQLQRHLYKSIRAHLVGLWDIFPKVAKDHNPHIQVLSQSVVGEMSGQSDFSEVFWMIFAETFVPLYHYTINMYIYLFCWSVSVYIKAALTCSCSAWPPQCLS